MTEKASDKYLKILETFDKLTLENIHERRTACKPLYDYFQTLTLEVGVTLCGLDQNSLKTYHLKTRWENIKYCLSYVDDPGKWEDVINEIHNIRSKVEHEDDSDPKPERLKEIRKKAPEFKDWIVQVAQEYYRKSKGFTFKEAFYHLSHYYIIQAEYMLREFGEKPPYVAEPEHHMELEEYPYQQLSQLVHTSKERLPQIAKLENIERPDLEKLVQLVKIISYFRGKEDVLLRYSVCPKCGGAIKETERYSGGTYEDSEPTSIHVRIGCEKCDYELHNETIDL